MLVLIRKIGSTLTIGNDIKIVLLGIDGGQAKIGIECDKSIPILRDDAIKRDRDDNGRDD